MNQVRLDEERRFAERTPIDILLVAQDCTLDKCPPLDILIVPGGMGERLENHNLVILEFIRSCEREIKTLTPVCTGAFLLSGTGVLDGRAATTHFSSIERPWSSFPSIKVEEGVRFVEDDKLITSVGILARIDMSLRLVAIHFGEDIAPATASALEYPYPPDNYRNIEG